jgi:hypothetical protein
VVGNGKCEEKQTGLDRNKDFRNNMKILGVMTSFIKLAQELRIQNEESYLERHIKTGD